ncbi:MAG: hypothetical protein ABIF22_03200 [bacterium]
MKNIKEITKHSVVLAVLMASFVIPTVSKAQYYYPLQVSCHPNTYSAQVNTTVGWSASMVGGNGIYTYSWTGSDGLSGNSNPISNTYTTEGTKVASITVTSAGQFATVNCGSVNVYSLLNYYGSLNGSCSVNVSSTQVGNIINWSGYASGGNGVYTYYWSDSDGYLSTGQYLSRYYTYAGYKNMNLIISSNGQSVTRTCSVYVSPSPSIINPVYPTYPTYPTHPVQNQVLAYNNSRPNISAVYLSDVPSTGFEDFAKPVFFVFALIIWSSVLAYMFLKNKEEKDLEKYL